MEMKEIVLAFGQIIGVFILMVLLGLVLNFFRKGLGGISRNEMNYYKK